MEERGNEGNGKGELDGNGGKKFGKMEVKKLDLWKYNRK